MPPSHRLQGKAPTISHDMLLVTIAQSAPAVAERLGRIQPKQLQQMQQQQQQQQQQEVLAANDGWLKQEEQQEGGLVKAEGERLKGCPAQHARLQKLSVPCSAQRHGCLHALPLLLLLEGGEIEHNDAPGVPSRKAHSALMHEPAACAAAGGEADGAAAGAPGAARTKRRAALAAVSSITAHIRGVGHEEGAPGGAEGLPKIGAVQQVGLGTGLRAAACARPEQRLAAGTPPASGASATCRGCRRLLCGAQTCVHRALPTPILLQQGQCVHVGMPTRHAQEYDVVRWSGVVYNRCCHYTFHPTGVQRAGVLGNKTCCLKFQA